MMRAFIVLGISLLSIRTFADASVKAGPSAAVKCDYEQGPFETGRRDPELTKLGEKLKMTFAQATARHLLFVKGRWTNERMAVVLDAKSKRAIVWVTDQVVALVEDSAGELVGLLAVDEDARELRLTYAQGGEVQWRHSQGGYSDDSAAVIVDGEQLIIATWHRIATGSRLFALDRKTGALRWTANVEQLNVGHSEYFNDVALALHDGIVTMRGMEAAGCYVQTFDAATGKRRSSQNTMKW